MIAAASIIRMDAIEGPKVEYFWAVSQELKNSFFSQRNLVQLYTISTMNSSFIPRMIQYKKGTCLISLNHSSSEGNILLTLLMDKSTTPDAQTVLWRKIRALHGRLKTIKKLSCALDKLVTHQIAS